MKDPDRPRIPLRALWRIPAVIALVACAVASRMALGATGPVILPGGGAAALRELAAAMVITDATDGVETAVPVHHDFILNSRFLLDIAEAVYVLPPVAVSAPPAPHTEAVATVTSTWSAGSPPPPRPLRLDPSKT